MAQPRGADSAGVADLRAGDGRDVNAAAAAPGAIGAVAERATSSSAGIAPSAACRWLVIYATVRLHQPGALVLLCGGTRGIYPGARSGGRAVRLE